ncbi:hypothetical protein F1D05_01585 [Kribbella qitaiheensis]|uniref:Endonuclease/exonuclease/phosphatase family protein n=1 Tax=Kribbella qitaiheensis TaxID=1544730 RepID=A0A7G6WS63_9ACTN|nr:hypothetical protein [Kribbella qitaiheensis]QNE16828.1 hypothetical protein F1D05_01585 [Kribbella qitaiheensis]
MVNRISRRQALKLGGGVVAGAAVAGSLAGSAEAAGDWIRLPIITANIGRKNLGARQAAIAAVRDGDPGNRPFVGWQEISEGDTGEPAMISQSFGDAYTNMFLNHPNSYRVPISVPQPWNLYNSDPIFVHGVVPDVSPPRWINEVVVQHNAHPGLKFTLMNTHYLYNAYNGAQRPNLRPYWDLHKKIHRERVMAHHNNGTLVIWTADTNNPNYDTATAQPNEHSVYTGGIDRINWLPGDGTVQLDFITSKIIPLNVDGHDAHEAIFHIRLA